MAKSLRGLPDSRRLTGGEYKQKLRFVPCADNQPKLGHEISEAAIFRFLLNEETLKQLDETEAETTQMLGILKDVDKEAKITQVEAYQSSMGRKADAFKAYHVFIVFKSTSETAEDGVHWWSLEKNLEFIVLQRSRSKDNVKDKLEGEGRKRVKPIREDLKGKGTIKDLFALLWVHQVIPEKYNIFKSNCQSLVTFVSKQITEIEYEYKGYFPYSPPSQSGRDKKMLDLINILRGCRGSGYPPLFLLIRMGNINLVDKMIKSGNYDINACNNECKLTPLHFAISFSKTEMMVTHLLKPPLNADPTRRDESGRSALLFAAAFTQQPEIFDLLLEHDKVKVDDVDNDGLSALHYAAYTSNVVTVEKLIGKGANPNAVDKKGRSPLHLAAQERDGCPIIDLLLEAQKVKGMGDVNDRDKHGRTALHFAAYASNEITAEHLIQKGADLHCRDDDGKTPLHMAAMYATDMQIIDVLLRNITEGDFGEYRRDDQLLCNVMCNMHGLVLEVGKRLFEKGIMKLTPSSETDECSQEIDEILKEEQLDINGRDENGDTPLILAIRAHKFKTVVYLLENGADPTIRNSKGFTPFHLSADSDSYIPHLLLTNDKVDINETTSYCGLTALHLAIINSNLPVARFLLLRGANPTAADKNGATPLHLAALYAKDMDIVELLLNHPDVDVDCFDGRGRSVLDYATMNTHGHGERIANLLEEKSVGQSENQLRKLYNKICKKHVRDYINRKPDGIENCVADDTIPIEAKIDKILENKDYLVSAIKDSNVESVRLLLKNGADNMTWGEEGANALHLASCYAETTDIIDVILETGKFDINGLDNAGRTPLFWAIIIPKLKIVRHLIQKGADPTIANKNGNTPLHMAAFQAKSIETVNLLLGNNQVDINGRNKDGMTVLHCAISANRMEIVRCLLEKGADPTLRDSNGNTPFHLAAEFLTDTDVLDLMLGNEKKINIDEKNKFGRTALHRAIQESNVTAARFLLSKGANPNAADNNGIIPLHVASKYAKDLDIVKLLLNHKDTNVNSLGMLGNEKQIDIDEKNNVGFNALHAAVMHSNETTVRFLLSKGANPNVTDGNGATPLHVAAMFAKDMGMVKLLVNHPDVNVNYLDNRGNTALVYTMGNKHGLGEEIANLLWEKMAPKAEGINHKPKNIAGLISEGHIKEDSDIETIRLSIENGMDISAMTWGEKVANALNELAATDEKTTQLILDVLEETNLYAGPTAPKCTSDDNNDNVVKEVLEEAIKHSDVEKVRNLIKMGADLGKTTWRKGVNALHLASRDAKKTEILEVILETGDFDINGRNENGRTALYYASFAENVEFARYLLEKGADPTIRANDGLTPFHIAAAFSRESDILDLFLVNNKEFDIDHRSQSGMTSGMTALHMAVMESNSVTAKFLLTKGANPNVTNENGATPLHLAALSAEDMDIVKLLVNHPDVDVDYLDNKGNNAQHCARYNLFGLGEAIANLLGEKKAAKAEGINQEPKNIAALVPGYIKEDFDIKSIRFLIENGQDIGAMTWGQKGTNALHAAAADEETTDLIDIILETGKFDINGVDNDGRTPLHYAIKRPKPITINARRLIKMGADPSIADKNGVTPLHMAARNAESMDLIELLLNTEAVDVNLVDRTGRTALACARDNKHGLSERIIARLMEYDDEKK